jgi:curli biogenesis system outer membrane secretion channel CsgG
MTGRRIGVLALSAVLLGALGARAQDQKAPAKSKKDARSPAAAESKRDSTEFQPAPGSEKEQERPKLAVIDFSEGTVDAAVAGEVGKTATEAVVAELNKKNRFDIYPRRSLQKVLSDLNITDTTNLDEPTVGRIGRYAEVNYVLYGTVDNCRIGKTPNQKGTSAKVAVSFKILDVSTRRLTQQEHLSDEALAGANDDPKELVRTAIQRTVEDFSRLVSPEGQGKVALVDKDKGDFVINLGSTQGISKGVYFRVFRNVREIHDPDTGQVIGFNSDTVCWGRVTDVQEKLCRCEPGESSRNDLGIIRWHSKPQKLGDLRVGDMVEVVRGKVSRTK